MKCLTTFAILSTLTGIGACSFAEDDHPALRLEPVEHATLYIEVGAEFPGEPLLSVVGVLGPSTIDVELSPSLQFPDGGHQEEVPITGAGVVDLPTLVGGHPDPRASVTFTGPDGQSRAVPAIVLEPGSVGRIRAAMRGDDGVVAAGAGFLLLDEGRVQAPDDGDYSAGGSSLLGICWCPFVGNVGKLTVDTSCRGRLAMWMIPENGSAAFTPVTATIKYDADGFKIGSTIYKIDGSTCNTMTCGTSSVSISSCVNNLAAMLGKSSPYPVQAGTFGNEPPPGASAQYVR